MSKITAYGPIPSLAMNDLLPIVDIDDLAMAPTGTTCNITVNVLHTPVVTVLTDASTIAVDASTGTVFTLALTGSGHTLGNPVNAADGMLRRFRVSQPASGGPYTLGYGTAYQFTAQLPAPTLSTAALAIDELGFSYFASLGIWVLMAYMLGI